MRRLPYLVILLCLVGAALVGCTSSDTSDTTAPTNPPVTTTQVPTSTTTIIEGSPVPLANGDFETGDFTSWTVESWGSGDWFIYEDGSTPPDPSVTDTANPFDVPDPPQGQHAAVTDMDYSGVHFLYRDIEVAGPWTLHAVVFYENSAGSFYVQEDFGRIDGEAWLANARNQQYRIDIIDPTAPIESLEADEVLAAVFWTQPEDPPSLGPTPISVDLSQWDGQTVRLRIAEIDNGGALRAGIDDVLLMSSD